MKSSVFRQDYHDCLNVQSRLHITVGAFTLCGIWVNKFSFCYDFKGNSNFRMKQIAHIAKTRGYVLAELLYIQSSASRQRPFVIFCQRFCMSFYLSENNE